MEDEHNKRKLFSSPKIVGVVRRTKKQNKPTLLLPLSFSFTTNHSCMYLLSSMVQENTVIVPRNDDDDGRLPS